MLTDLEYRFLSRFYRRKKGAHGIAGQITPYSKLDRHIGPSWASLVENRVVLDFGCGVGHQVQEIASAGAKKVYGLETSPNQLALAGRSLSGFALADRCCISSTLPEERIDCIICIDCFEHFADPLGVLNTMYSLLKPNAAAHISFGPTWYHPLGGHAFSAFPWAHLLIREQALVRWRNDFLPGTSVGFESSGLNRMTIRRFRSLVGQTDFELQGCQAVPIRSMRWIHNPLTREFTTSAVHATLRRRG